MEGGEGESPPADGAADMDVGAAAEIHPPSDEQDLQKLETHDELHLDDKPSSPSEVSALGLGG